MKQSKQEKTFRGKTFDEIMNEKQESSEEIELLSPYERSKVQAMRKDERHHKDIKLRSVRTWRSKHKEENKEMNRKVWDKLKDITNEKRRERYKVDDAYRLKYQAKEKVRRAIRMGLLSESLVCNGCGIRSRLEAHHKDYNQPLEVTWLCRTCHKKEHRRFLK